MLFFMTHTVVGIALPMAEQVFEPEVKTGRPRRPSCPRQLCSRWPSKSTLSRLRARHRFSEEQGSFRAAPCRTVPFLVVSCRSVASRSHSIRAVPALSVQFANFGRFMLFMWASVPIFADVSCCLIVSHVDSCCSMLSHVVSCRPHVVPMLSHIAP
jgi:hypothetical protein